MKYPTYCWLRYLLDCHIKYIHLVLYWPPLEGGRKRRRPILKLLVWANVPPKMVVDMAKTCVVALCWLFIIFYNYICVRRLQKRSCTISLFTRLDLFKTLTIFARWEVLTLATTCISWTIFFYPLKLSFPWSPATGGLNNMSLEIRGGENEIRQRQVRRGMSEVFRANVRTTDWVGSIPNTII